MIGNDCVVTPKKILRSQENLLAYPMELIEKKNKLIKEIRNEKGNSMSGEVS